MCNVSGPYKYFSNNCMTCIFGVIVTALCGESLVNIYFKMRTVYNPTVNRS